MSKFLNKIFSNQKVIYVEKDKTIDSVLKNKIVVCYSNCGVGEYTRLDNCSSKNAVGVCPKYFCVVLTNGKSVHYCGHKKDEGYFFGSVVKKE